MLMPMRARQIWFCGPSWCWQASGGQFLFVGAPAHLGRRRPLLAEALDAPGIDELVDLLGAVGDLRVALAAMDDLHAQAAGQAVEAAGVDPVADFLGLGAGRPACRPAGSRRCR